jgi:hypothetical protein
MNSLLNLFKKELARCNLCNSKIYNGDYYGNEHEASSLSISGYCDYYFCSTCIDKNCASGKLGEESLGKTFIISRRSGERSRITIRH